MLKGGVFGFGNVGQWMTTQINVNNEFGDGVRIVAASKTVMSASAPTFR